MLSMVRRLTALGLLRSGATVVEPLEYRYARSKASGAMWEGSLVLKKSPYIPL